MGFKLSFELFYPRWRADVAGTRAPKFKAALEKVLKSNFTKLQISFEFWQVSRFELILLLFIISVLQVKCEGGIDNDLYTTARINVGLSSFICCITLLFPNVHFYNGEVFSSSTVKCIALSGWAV